MGHFPLLLCECLSSINPFQKDLLICLLKFPSCQVFKPRTPPEAIALCSRLLEYTPVTRLSPLEACAHAFFDELRQPNTRLPSGRELPLLFNFSPVGQFTHRFSNSVGGEKVFGNHKFCNFSHLKRRRKVFYVHHPSTLTFTERMLKKKKEDPKSYLYNSTKNRYLINNKRSPQCFVQ